MFTGIITDVGQVRAVDARRRHGASPSRHRSTSTRLAIGASIACAGVCLTVIEKGRGLVRRPGLGRDAGAHHARRLARRHARSISSARSRAATSWAGISSSGHVDAVAEIVERRPEGDSLRFVFEVPPGYETRARVQGLGRARRRLADRQRGRGPPLRRQHHPASRRRRPRFGTAAVGDRVNLEIDVIARYVARILGRTLT